MNELTWGDPCRRTDDQDCAKTPNCKECKYSWPSNDPKAWKSQDARCRCKNPFQGDAKSGSETTKVKPVKKPEPMVGGPDSLPPKKAEPAKPKKPAKN